MDRATVSEDASALLELVGAPDAPTRLRSEWGGLDSEWKLVNQSVLSCSIFSDVTVFSSLSIPLLDICGVGLESR
jgi:hypothetical protein